VSWQSPSGSPPKTAWLAKKGTSRTYRQSGVEVAPVEFPPWLLELMGSLMPTCGIENQNWPDGCHLSLFEGSAGMGWQQDEQEFEEKTKDSPGILLAFGASRTLELRPSGVEDGSATLSTQLGPGDMLALEGRSLQRYQMRLLPSDAGPSVLLLFRRVGGAPEDSSQPADKSPAVRSSTEELAPAQAKSAAPEPGFTASSSALPADAPSPPSPLQALTDRAEQLLLQHEAAAPPPPAANSCPSSSVSTSSRASTATAAPAANDSLMKQMQLQQMQQQQQLLLQQQMMQRQMMQQRMMQQQMMQPQPMAAGCSGCMPCMGACSTMPCMQGVCPCGAVSGCSGSPAPMAPMVQAQMPMAMQPPPPA